MYRMRMLKKVSLFLSATFAICCVAAGQSGSVRGTWSVTMTETDDESQYCIAAPPSTFPLTVDIRETASKYPDPVLIFSSAPASFLGAKAYGNLTTDGKYWDRILASWNSQNVALRIEARLASATEPAFGSFKITYEELDNGEVACRAQYTGGPFSRLATSLAIPKNCKSSCKTKCVKKPKKSRAQCEQQCGDKCALR